MEKLKELLKNKKIIASVTAVLLLLTVGTVFALNQSQQTKETVQQETISDEEHSKLMASIKSMQEADAQAKAKKAEEEKKQAEEKAKKESEEKAKEEAEKQQEETQTNENTTSTTASSNTNSSSSNATVANNTASAVTKPATPVVAPKPQLKPAEPKPTPAPEKPKPTKYCEYNGPRKPVQNICNNGSPWANEPTGWSKDDYVVKQWIKRINNGEIDMIVFKGETDRYHLIENEKLREGLINSKDPRSDCYVRGTCRGFRLP